MVMPANSSSVLSTPPPTPPLEVPATFQHPRQKPPTSPNNKLKRPPQHSKKHPPPPPPRSEQTRIESNGPTTPPTHTPTAPKEKGVPKKPAPGRGARVPRFSKNAEEYFRGVSPMCRRLLDDMDSIRESWGQEWASLSYEQQCKILDQAIVDEVSGPMG